MTIYIANLDTSINNETLKNLFSQYGEVASAKIAYDAFTGTSRGFANVEMEDDDAAQKAIKALNNTKYENLTISVQEAVPAQVHKGSYKVGSGPVNVYRFKKN